jgi:hypothetical protein
MAHFYNNIFLQTRMKWFNEGFPCSLALQLEWISLAESERQPYKKVSAIAMKRFHQKQEMRPGISFGRTFSLKCPSKKKSIVFFSLVEFVVECVQMPLPILDFDSLIDN